MTSKGFFEEISSGKKASKGSSEPWLLSYADLVTNLMAIFVLLFSMSTLDKAKLDTVASEIQNRETDNLQELKKKIDTAIHENKLQKELRTTLDFEGLRVIFQGSSMFASASAELIPAHVERISPILSLIGKIDARYQISLEGHTDDVPLARARAAKFADNWALSSARGVSLLHVLAKRGVPVERMNVGGYADTRPVVEPKGLSGAALSDARAMNRRVVIRIFQ